MRRTARASTRWAGTFPTSSGAGSGNGALARGLAGLGMGRSLSIAYFRSGRLARRVSRRLREKPYDAVYISSSPMVEYVRGTTLPVVMDFVDVDSDKWTQYATKQRPPISWA